MRYLLDTCVISEVRLLLILSVNKRPGHEARVPYLLDREHAGLLGEDPPRRVGKALGDVSVVEKTTREGCGTRSQRAASPQATVTDLARARGWSMLRPKARPV